MSLHEALGGSARPDVAHRDNPLPRDELTTEDLCSATCLRSRMSSAVTSLQILVTAEHRGTKWDGRRVPQWVHRRGDRHETTAGFTRRSDESGVTCRRRLYDWTEAAGDSGEHAILVSMTRTVRSTSPPKRPKAIRKAPTPRAGQWFLQDAKA